MIGDIYEYEDGLPIKGRSFSLHIKWKRNAIKVLFFTESMYMKFEIIRRNIATIFNLQTMFAYLIHACIYIYIEEGIYLQL